MAGYMATISNAFSLYRVDEGFRLGMKSKDETEAKLISWGPFPPKFSHVHDYTEPRRIPVQGSHYSTHYRVRTRCRQKARTTLELW